MAKKQQLEKIIRDACPDLCVNKHAQLIHLDHTVEYFEEWGQPGLQELLRAINHLDMCCLEGKLLFHIRKESCRYDLTKNLFEQSKKTLNFIYDIFNIK